MLPLLGELPELVATTGGGDVRRAWTYFVAIAALLLVFVTIVAAVMVSRHVRRSLEQRAAGEGREHPESPDPWQEAGRRAKPFPRPPQDDGED